MSREYLRLFYKHSINIVFIGVLLLVQGLLLSSGVRPESALDLMLAQKSLSTYAMLFTPLFFFWNAPVYRLCSETKLVVRTRSPFAYLGLYTRLSLLSSLLYVVVSNCVTVAGVFVIAPSAEGGERILLLLLFQLIFYVNCALLTFLVVSLLHKKLYFAFLAVVLYGLIDYVGSAFLLFEDWVGISTSYVVSYPEEIRSLPLLVKNFSVLAGTLLCLFVIAALVTDKKDFMDGGKAHG